jgi:transcriptional regulator with XRE-family HTH domain
VAVMLELRAASETTADLADRIGEDPAWLTRKLHGQTPIDIGDVMKWAAELGVQIIPVFDDGMELQLTLS